MNPLVKKPSAGGTRGARDPAASARVSTLTASPVCRPSPASASSRIQNGLRPLGSSEFQLKAPAPAIARIVGRDAARAGSATVEQMSTGEGVDARDDRSDRDDRDRRGERIGVGGGDDSVTRIQLAARWAESYGPPTDSLGGVLKRFRAAFEYLDAVTHGVEPPNIEEQQPEAARTPPAAQPVPGGPG